MRLNNSYKKQICKNRVVGILHCEPQHDPDVGFSNPTFSDAIHVEAMKIGCARDTEILHPAVNGAYLMVWCQRLSKGSSMCHVYNMITMQHLEGSHRGFSRLSTDPTPFTRSSGVCKGHLELHLIL